MGGGGEDLRRAFRTDLSTQKGAGEDWPRPHTAGDRARVSRTDHHPQRGEGSMGRGGRGSGDGSDVGEHRGMRAEGSGVRGERGEARGAPPVGTSQGSTSMTPPSHEWEEGEQRGPVMGKP